MLYFLDNVACILKLEDKIVILYGQILNWKLSNIDRWIGSVFIIGLQNLFLKTWMQKQNKPPKKPKRFSCTWQSRRMDFALHPDLILSNLFDTISTISWLKYTYNMFLYLKVLLVNDLNINWFYILGIPNISLKLETSKSCKGN